MLGSIRLARHGFIKIQLKAPLKPLSSTLHLWERQTWPRYLLRGVQNPCVLLWNLLTWGTLITTSFDKMFEETTYIALMLWFAQSESYSSSHFCLALFGFCYLARQEKCCPTENIFKKRYKQKKMFQWDIYCGLLKLYSTGAEKNCGLAHFNHRKTTLVHEYWTL